VVDLAWNSYDLSRFNGFYVREASGCVRQQVFQTVRFCAEDDHSDTSSSQVLLIFDALVHGEENVKFGGFRRREKSPFLNPASPA
jgi:hypothetical protein